LRAVLGPKDGCQVSIVGVGQICQLFVNVLRLGCCSHFVQPIVGHLVVAIFELFVTFALTAFSHADLVSVFPVKIFDKLCPLLPESILGRDPFFDSFLLVSFHENVDLLHNSSSELSEHFCFFLSLLFYLINRPHFVYLSLLFRRQRLLLFLLQRDVFETLPLDYLFQFVFVVALLHFNFYSSTLLICRF